MAIAMPILLGMAGFAVDMGRLYVAKARLQAAVDAAALAGSLQLFRDPDLTEGIVANSVNEYLSRNYREATVVDIFPGTEVRSVGVKARVTVPMTFMGALGIRSRIVESSATAGFNDLEIALVIDDSGTMEGEPIDEVKQAIHGLVDMLIPEGHAASVKIGLVPFRGKVRVGAGVDGGPEGCRNADGTLNRSNISPPDLSCSDLALPPILALTREKAQINAAVNLLEALRGDDLSSGTVISEGIKWGRQALSPEYPYQQGGNPTQYHKVMILVSDGDNNDGRCGGEPANGRRNAYFGMGVTNCNCQSNGCLDQAMEREANLAKQRDGIEIFVVRYGDSDNSDIQLLKQVASSRPGTDDHYFDTATPDDIREMFKRIGRQLGFRIIN